MFVSEISACINRVLKIASIFVKPFLFFFSLSLSLSRAHLRMFYFKRVIHKGDVNPAALYTRNVWIGYHNCIGAPHPVVLLCNWGWDITLDVMLKGCQLPCYKKNSFCSVIWFLCFFNQWQDFKVTSYGFLCTDDCFALLLSIRWMFSSHPCMFVFTASRYLNFSQYLLSCLPQFTGVCFCYRYTSILISY